MANIRRSLANLKGRAIRGVGGAVAAARRLRTPNTYLPGVATVITVNWNSLAFLRPMLSAVERLSPPGTNIWVVDNASSDGSWEYLSTRSGIRAFRLPVNVGHGVALDLVIPKVNTEYLAILDVDAFPVSPVWLENSISALNKGAQVAGAQLHRNFVHPCFLVTRTTVVHEYGLTFRPVGSLSTLEYAAPLFMDVGEALNHRLQIKFGGAKALHFFQPTSIAGPGMAGAVFGDLVYHNLYSTQGVMRETAMERFGEAFARHHADIEVR